MNIFVLDDTLEESAMYHVDKHVVKMPVEAMQIASTAMYAQNLAEDYCRASPAHKLYKPTHVNHPIVQWASKSHKNLYDVVLYGMYVGKEYSHRYPRLHATVPILHLLHSYLIDAVDEWATFNGFDGMPQCMPDEFKLHNTVASYRNYYAIAKSHIHKWTNRPTPQWCNGCGAPA
jgi:hypothetical protein